MFRPTPVELAALFPGTKVVASEIVDCGTSLQYVTRTRTKLSKRAARLGLPFYQPKGWLTAVRRLAWLFRGFQAVCVVLEKV